MFNNINEFLSKLNKVSESSKGQYTACCPAHDDKNPSLSIKVDGNKILLNCHAGCRYEDILSALSLQKEDMYIGKNDHILNYKGEIYDYQDEFKNTLYRKIKFYKKDGKKSFLFESPNGERGKTCDSVPYNLPAVIGADTIYFVEGEKCANKLIQLGYTATTLDTGAKSPWYDSYNKYFEDKEVIILPDNDKPGFKYAFTIKQNLPYARVIKLNDLEEKEDVYDWLEKGHSMEEIKMLPEFDIENCFSRDKVSTEKESQAEQIIRLVLASGITFFHDNINNPYAVILRNNHREVVNIKSGQFKEYITKLYYDSSSKVCKKDIMSQVITVLSANAKYDNADSVEVSTRVACYNDCFYYCLTNPNWEAVKINKAGWSVDSNPPSIFIRHAHHKSQVEPNPNGDVVRILNYINISSNKILFLCWMISCFIPGIPHPMPIFYGEKGAAKSTACKLLKRVIDPSELDTLTMPKNLDNMIVNLSKHWFLPFDNVSSISDDISDILCRAITGDGIQKRKLYSDNDDCIYKFQKCITLNGINNVATKPDLLDRAILIELSRIKEENRKELTALENEFEKDLPFILGGIFNVLSKTMNIYENISLDKLPRMADFCRWGYAIGEALGNFGNQFLEEYKNNINSQNIEVLNSDTVADLIIKFMNTKVNSAEWEGKVSELYSELLKLKDCEYSGFKSFDFPKQPNVLSRRLNGIKSNLETVGISFRTTATAAGTVISIYNENYRELPDYAVNLEDTLKTTDNTNNICEDFDEDIVSF